MTEKTTEQETAQVDFEIKETREEEGSVKRFVVETARETLDSRLDDVLKELKQSVTIPGFRPGKAPLALLRKQFGKDAEKDALNSLAEDVARQIGEKEDIELLGQPTLHDSKVGASGPITLEIDLEHKPVIQVEEYQGREYEVEVPPVTEELVEKQIKEIQEANVTYEVPEDKDRAFAKGDGLNVDMEVTDKDGNLMEMLSRDNAFLSDPFQNLPSEVAEALVGKKAGDKVEVDSSRTVNTAEGEEVEHKDHYVVTLKEVKERVRPELDDDFAAEVGEFKSMDELRQRIRDDLQQMRNRREREGAMDKILTHLTEKNAFDAPKSVVSMQQYQTMMRDYQQLQQMGLSLEAMGMDSKAYAQHAKEGAEKFVKANYLIEAIAKQEEIAVTDEDVEKEIERRAEEEGRKPLAIRAKLEKEEGGLEQLKRQLEMSKVEDFLLEKNTIKVKEVDPQAQQAGAEI